MNLIPRDVKFYIPDFVREAFVAEEIILLNEETEIYIGLEGSAKIIWLTLKQTENMTLDTLIQTLAKEWIMSEVEKNYIYNTLDYFITKGIIRYVKE